MEEQIKHAHKVVDVVERRNRNICLTLLRLRCNLDKPETCYAQDLLVARTMEEKKFQQNVYLKYYFEENSITA